MARAQDKNNGANLGFEAKLWAYGPPLKGNTNFAWAQNIVHHGAGVA
jgi:hypothetical protein